MRNLHQKYCTESYDANGVLSKFETRYPDDFNFAYDVVDDIALNDPQRRAMVWCNPEGEEHTFTFADMKLWSDKTANFLAGCGIGRGDRVLVILRRHYQFWFVATALHKLGAVMVPATCMLKEPDLSYRIDEAGVATVLEDMGPGGVFGRHLAFAGFAADSLEVVARTACDILFIDNSCIFKRCENACTHHSTLVYNMMNLLSNKTRSLSERVDVLSRRSIREKLLCYFRQQAEKSGEDLFPLPFSLSVLADYIATDRSAMMRELRHLKEQGIVCTDGRQIRLLGERPTA